MNKVTGWYKSGDAVQWTSKRGRTSGQVTVGVVVDGPKGKHSYYTVSTAGQTFKVPSIMLSPSKVAPKLAKALEEKGQKFKETLARNVAKRDEEQLRACQRHLDTFPEIVRGATVKNRGVQGWPHVMVYEVDREAGKVKVESSTAALRDLAELHGLTLGRGRTRRSTWVLANRLYPV